MAMESECIMCMVLHAQEIAADEARLESETEKEKVES